MLGGWVEGVGGQTGTMGYRCFTKEEWKDAY